MSDNGNNEESDNCSHHSPTTSGLFTPPIQPEGKITLLRTKDYASVSKIAERDHLIDDNWHEWKERMKQVFRNCGITGYVNGTTKKPSVVQDPYGRYLG
jgi:hypothetical protein